MTSFLRLTALKAITLTAALSMTAGIAIAGDNTVPADQIINKLQPKPLTRGLIIGQSPNKSSIPRQRPGKSISSIHCATAKPVRSRLASARKSPKSRPPSRRSISTSSSNTIRPRSAHPRSRPSQELGKALSDASLKGSTFVVAGHTDAVGGEAYNQDLSERRADTIKRYLTEKFGITGSDLVTVGYGKTRPIDPNAPMDPLNRRVQVVNMDTKTASK